jgi:hypothetical protein
MKKIARTLRTHRELLLNYFKAKKQFSSGVVEGLNNKAKVTMRDRMASAPFASWNSPSITRLASSQSPSAPMNSSDEADFETADVGAIDSGVHSLATATSGGEGGH